MEIHVEVEGLDAARRKMEQVVKDLHGTPMQMAMRDATLLVQRAAMQNAPVDTGRLRASITPEVRTEGRTVIGVVGSNLFYAPYSELGTRPHWPPLAALEVWARRHGTTAFVVARAISRRGTKAVRFLQRAVEDNQQRIVTILDRAVGKIVEGR
jgi:HK97 gp10 family phage protein